MRMKIIFQDATAATPADRMCWPKSSRLRPLDNTLSQQELAGALLHALALLAACVWAAVTHYRTGNLAGPYAYLFLGACFFTFVLCVPVTRPMAHLFSLRGIIELWFVLDYVVYGTLLSAGLPPKIPLPVPAEDAYSQAYFAGALAVLGYGLGARFAGAEAMSAAGSWQEERTKDRPAPLLIGIFVAFLLMGFVGLGFLLANPQIRESLLFRQFGLMPPPGMGRYSSLFFTLPSTGIAVVYLVSLLRPARSLCWRMTAIILCGALSLVHLVQGRRLMWICSLLMAGYLLRKAGVMRVRWFHLALVLALAIPASVYYEQNKNAGWLTSQGFDSQTLVSGDQALETLRNSVGRFDIGAALISSRPDYGYHYGRTFSESFLHALPTSLLPDRPLGIGQEIGELIYNNFGIRLVTQAGSLVAELDANFGLIGIAVGMVLLGWGSSKLDGAAHTFGPLGAIGYALVLFRFPHHMVVSSYAATPLTVWAVAPWLAALILFALQALLQRRDWPAGAV